MSSFTHLYDILKLYDFLFTAEQKNKIFWRMSERFLSIQSKVIESKTTLDANDFRCMDKKRHFFLKTLLFLPHKRVSQTGLEQHEGE